MKKFFIFSFFIISNLISTTKIMAGCVPCPTIKICQASYCGNYSVGYSGEWSPSTSYSITIDGTRAVSCYSQSGTSGSDGVRCSPATISYYACDELGHKYTSHGIFDKNGKLLYK